MKRCVDCKHYKNRSSWFVPIPPPHDLCMHPDLVSPVNGTGVDANFERINPSVSGCGKDGKRWEAKTK